jgi:hypothetical protein
MGALKRARGNHSPLAGGGVFVVVVIAISSSDVTEIVVRDCGVAQDEWMRRCMREPRPAAF